MFLSLAFKVSFYGWLPPALGPEAGQNTVTAGACLQGGVHFMVRRKQKREGKEREFFRIPFLGSYGAGGMPASPVLGPTSCSFRYLPEAHSATNTLWAYSSHDPGISEKCYTNPNYNGTLCHVFKYFSKWSLCSSIVPVLYQF